MALVCAVVLLRNSPLTHSLAPITCWKTNLEKFLHCII